jgi:hypothetical protein
MRYGCSLSKDYDPYRVVVRDFKSEPLQGRVLAIIARDNEHEAQEIGQQICDLLNREENVLDSV